jgi:(p)ppGpp synthase/HD superfamily hydrolase
MSESASTCERATLSDAIMLATLLHQGQKDKAGQEYILHPLRVMILLGAKASVEERMAALLHDTLEDCGMTRELLAQKSYPGEVLDALERLTKSSEDEEYGAFIARCAPDAIARRVKIADLRDNMDLSRIPSPTARDHERIAKYERALKYLQEWGRE